MADASSPSTAVEPSQGAPQEKVPFWNRPYVERYLTPLVLPVVVVLGVVFYILNVSRLFLSAHGHVPIIIATVITLVILIGAAVLSGADFLRSRQMILVTVGCVIAITFAGWISLGHSAEKIEAAGTLPSGLKASQTETVTAAPGGNLAFAPDAFIGPVFTHTRKGDVAHLRADADSVRRGTESARVAAVVFPDFQAGETVSVRALEPATAFLKLAGNAFNYEVVGEPGFRAVTALVRSAKAHILRYGDLADAHAALDALVRDAVAA